MPTGHPTGLSAAQSSVSRRNSNFCQWHVKLNVPENPAGTGNWAARQSFRPSTSQENKKGNRDLFYFGKILISNAEMSRRPNKRVQGEPGIWWENSWALSELIWALVHHGKVSSDPCNKWTESLQMRCDHSSGFWAELMIRVCCRQCRQTCPSHEGWEHLLTHENQPRAKLKQVF